MCVIFSRFSTLLCHIYSKSKNQLLDWKNYNKIQINYLLMDIIWKTSSKIITFLSDNNTLHVCNQNELFVSGVSRTTIRAEVMQWGRSQILIHFVLEL